MTGLANPALVFTVLWGVVLGLTHLRLTSQLTDLNPSTLLLVGANVASIWIIFIVALLLMRSPVSVWEARAGGLDLPMLRRMVSGLLKFWVVGTLIEIIVSGGVPLLWMITGHATKDYRDFGIPTVHGLLMAVYLFSLTALLLLYLIEGTRKDLMTALALLAWSVILIHRGAFIWALLELLAVFILVRRISPMRMVHVGALMLAGMLLFGIIGDLRAGAGKAVIREIATERGRILVDTLPSGFLWVYIYITSPVNNVNAGVDRLVPTNKPYFSTMNLLPTVIREKVWAGVENRYALTLVNEAFNTSTWYVNFLADFGVRGAVLIIAGLQCIIVFFYRQARRGYAWAILAYAAVFQALALSIFSDTLTSLVTIGQMGLAVTYGAVVTKAYRRAVADEDTPGQLALQEP